MIIQQSGLGVQRKSRIHPYRGDRLATARELLRGKHYTGSNRLNNVALAPSAGLGRDEKEPVPAGHDRPGAGVVVQGAEAVPIFLEAVSRD